MVRKPGASWLCGTGSFIFDGVCREKGKGKVRLEPFPQLKRQVKMVLIHIRREKYAGNCIEGGQMAKDTTITCHAWETKAPK